MRKLGLALVLFVAIAMTSCTDNSIVRNFGGEAEIELPAGQKLVNVSWKEDQLWYLTRPMTQYDSVETYRYSEKSAFGVLEGTYVIKESK